MCPEAENTASCLLFREKKFPLVKEKLTHRLVIQLKMKLGGFPVDKSFLNSPYPRGTFQL